MSQKISSVPCQKQVPEEGSNAVLSKLDHSKLQKKKWQIFPVPSLEGTIIWGNTHTQHPRGQSGAAAGGEFFPKSSEGVISASSVLRRTLTFVR